LASGNGKGNRAIYVNWISTLVFATLLVALCVFFSCVLRSDSNAYRAQADRIRDRPGLEERVQHQVVERVQRHDDRADELAWYATFVFWLGIVVAFVSIIATVSDVRSIAKTEITVYEKGIAGIGRGMFHDITNRTYRFQLTYDEIASISTLDWLFSLGIIIHAPNARYRCYVLDPLEIQMAIGAAKFGDRPLEQPA